MDKEKLNKISTKLTSNKENYMESFKKNVDLYVKQPDITIRELAEEAGIPFSTLNNFLYNNVNDMKLSTAIALSRALNVSIDELVGGETLPVEVRKSISAIRNLPDNSVFLIRWFIQRQINMCKNRNIKKNKFISVMTLICKGSGELYPTHEFTLMDIDQYSDDIKSKVFLGISMVCEHYMPLYSPYDTLLIANDRPAKITENCAIIYYKKLFIVKKRNAYENGKQTVKYSGIHDDKFVVDESEVDEVIGYIAGIHHDVSYLYFN